MTRVARQVRRRAPRRAGLALTIAAVVGAVTMSGCAVAGNQLHGGQAADVDGNVITTTRVDDITDGFCSYLASPEVREAQAQSGQTGDNRLPRTYFRGQVLGLLIQEAGMEELLRQHRVADPTGLQTQIDSYIKQYYPMATHGEAKAAVEQIAHAVVYLNMGGSALNETLPSDSGAAPDPTGAAAQQALADWLNGHDVEINPRYGIGIDEQGQISFVDDDTSVATSDDAKSVTAEVLNGFSTAPPTAEQQTRISTLPANQLCG